MLAAVSTALAKDVCGDHLLFNDSELASSFPRMLKLSSKFAAKNVLMDRKKCFILEHRASVKSALLPIPNSPQKWSRL